MTLTRLRIQNFRVFRDITVSLGGYNCFLGPNGSGKSTVLTALRIFFRDSSDSASDLVNLQQEDFHQKDTSKPVIVTLTFADLTPDAQKDFSEYYRQGELTVSAIAEWDPTTQRAPVKQYAQRLGMDEFRPYFRAHGDGEKVEDLRALYSQISKSVGGLPQETTKDRMTKALREFEASRPECCISISSEDQFYGISRAKDRLQKYIQWVYVPAVKDASTEQLAARQTALARLIDRTIQSKLSLSQPLEELRRKTYEEYVKLVRTKQDLLDGLAASLTKRLTEWAHPDAKLVLQWQDAPARSVEIPEPLAEAVASEGIFTGHISRFGHGLQRSFLLALLQELAGCDGVGGPRLLLACEEPELYQHPPQARHLAEVLERLSQGNSQVLVCTHSPYFVSGRGFEDVRMVRKDTKHAQAEVSSMSLQEVSARLAGAGLRTMTGATSRQLHMEQCLQPSLNEMFFASSLILVEGLEDVAFIVAYMRLLGLWPDYRRFGCHVVPVMGKSKLSQPIAVAKGLHIPVFVVFDSDADTTTPPERRALHEKENRGILSLMGAVSQDPFPDSTAWGADWVMWKDNIADVVGEDIGETVWEGIIDSTKQELGVYEAGDLKKNARFIAQVLTKAWEAGKRSKVMEKLCLNIIGFAAHAAGKAPSPALRAAVLPISQPGDNKAG